MTSSDFALSMAHPAAPWSPETGARVVVRMSILGLRAERGVETEARQFLDPNGFDALGCAADGARSLPPAFCCGHGPE
ncbi:MAG: hypothetical protein AAGC80_35910 [Rhodococcus sp. (in: high G+C Gram-positive bacteria)]